MLQTVKRSALAMWKNATFFSSSSFTRTVVSTTTSPGEERLGEPSNCSSSESTTSKNDKSHHLGNGYYKNPWSSAVTKNTSWVPSFNLPIALGGQVHESVKRVKTVRPDFDKKVGNHDMKVTWLGHAGVIVQMPPLDSQTRPITLLIDPIFSERASPSQYAGPGRYLGNPCKVEDLPHVDFVFISHNHYDHLDHPTIMKLAQRGGTRTRYVVPLGLRFWFLGCKIAEEQILEMDWWEETTLQPSQIDPDVYTEEQDQLGSVRVSCVPAQHNSARTGLDKNSTLWAGFVIEQFACSPSTAPERTTVYFAGDTGYRAESGGDGCPAFQQIGERYGPMDFSAIPIWRGGTLSFVSYMGIRLHPEALTRATHATPEDAVAIHADVKSRSSLAVHFATFAGSDDEATYPIVLLDEALQDAKLPTTIHEDYGFGVSDVGETFAIPVRPNASKERTEDDSS